MLANFIDSMLTNFSVYCNDVELYNVAFTVLCIVMPILFIGGILALVGGIIRALWGGKS